LTGRRTWLGLVAAVLTAALLWWGQGDGSTPTDQSPSPSSPTATGTSAADPGSGLPTVALADLPPEAADTVGLIDAGGPFPEDEDGGVFGNFEGLLPEQDRGYYREYTVQTPGLDHRGARRIVAGSSGELYWTADHYQSFERITR
jgi:ribonuclease T1